MFTAFLVAHIAAGAIGLVLGPVAMRAGKRPGTHTRAGELYHWNMLVVCLSAGALALMHWAEAGFLLYIAIFSYAFALVGYVAARTRPAHWLLFHISGMGGSYIALVTAFLIVQAGTDASLIVWLIPTIIGTPIISWVNYQVAVGKRPKGRAPVAA